MFKTGIVSVTFRQKSIDEIITLAKESGLCAIEVGSDVHAPRENLAECRRIADLAKEAEIAIASYGSYYRLGQGESFDEYIEAAKALGAPNIRIWAGAKGSASVDEETRAALTADAVRCAEAAAKAGITLSFEYHGGTLTDTSESALRLMREMAHPNAYLYWQPNQYKDIDFNLASLRAALPYVSNIHVFAWDARSTSNIRYPLADHAGIWKEYLDILAEDGRPHNLLMEFVKDDADDAFVSDAKTLKEWVKHYAV